MPSGGSLVSRMEACRMEMGSARSRAGGASADRNSLQGGREGGRETRRVWCFILTACVLAGQPALPCCSTRSPSLTQFPPHST